MKRIAAVLAFLAILGTACWAQPAAENERQLFRQIDEILTSLCEITGYKMLRPVPHELISSAGVRQYIEQRVQEEVKPEELRAEELVLKKFGFVSQEFDLKKTTIDLLSEQAAAFYDYRKKKLYVLDSSSTAVQEIALVHELAHALADQQFNLDKYIQKSNENDDAAMARLAVMEGQATWLMSEYVARRMGVSLRNTPAIARLMSQQAGLSAAEFPVFGGAPLYLRETLLFPYTQGMLFQQAVIEKEGSAAFAAVFKRPPASTRQVIHPGTYFAGDKPADPPLPSVSTPGGFRTLVEGSIGELDHGILLRQYGGEEQAAALAPRWRGGNYRLLESKADKHSVLEYSSQWEDAPAARQFFEFYREVLRKKWNKIESAAAGNAAFTGRGDDGYFAVRLDGARVTSIEGLNAPGEEKPGLR